MTDAPDLGSAIGAVITRLVTAAVAFATARPQAGLLELAGANDDLEILREKARQQYSQANRSRAAAP